MTATLKLHTATRELALNAGAMPVTIRRAATIKNKSFASVFFYFPVLIGLVQARQQGLHGFGYVFLGADSTTSCRVGDLPRGATN